MGTRSLAVVGVFGLAGVLGGGPSSNRMLTNPAPGTAGTAVPLGANIRVGERLTYSAHLNIVPVGSATLSVLGVEDVRGHATYHSVFDVKARMLWMNAHNHTETWFDTTTLTSLRLSKIVKGHAEEDTAAYEFYADRGVYVRNGESRPSVTDPVDEGSLLYYVRTLPLRPGDRYEINRFYRRDKNPIVIEVLGRERVSVPAGHGDAIVVRVTISANGLLTDHSDARLWLADDSSRRLLQLRAGVKGGTLWLRLTGVDSSARATPATSASR